MAENEKDAAKLLSVASDRHTTLRLFAQCTLHKLPHLLGLEVMYCFQETAYNVVVYGVVQACQTLAILNITRKTVGCHVIPASSSFRHYTTDNEHGPSSWFFQYLGLHLSMSWL
jgi:hypothetical protein